MNREEYRQVTGAGYLRVEKDILYANTVWLIDVIVNDLHGNNKLNIEMTDVIVSVTEGLSDSYTLCIEGIFKDNQVETIEYIMVVDENGNEYHLDNNVSNDNIIEIVNNNLNILNS
jgi:hypothetical protein